MSDKYASERTLMLQASPHLERIIDEQDREQVRRLLAYKPEGPLDAAQRDQQVDAILKRLERK